MLEPSPPMPCRKKKPNKPEAPPFLRRRFRLSKNASQSLLRQQRKESESFSAGAHPRVASLAPSGQFTSCTWQKIQLRLQVRCVAQRIQWSNCQWQLLHNIWNFFVYGEQIMRAAGCTICLKRISRRRKKVPPSMSEEGGTFQMPGFSGFPFFRTWRWTAAS